MREKMKEYLNQRSEHVGVMLGGLRISCTGFVSPASRKVDAMQPTGRLKKGRHLDFMPALPIRLLLYRVLKIGSICSHFPIHRRGREFVAFPLVRACNGRGESFPKPDEFILEADRVRLAVGVLCYFILESNGRHVVVVVSSLRHFHAQFRLWFISDTTVLHGQTLKTSGNVDCVYDGAGLHNVGSLAHRLRRIQSTPGRKVLCSPSSTMNNLLQYLLIHRTQERFICFGGAKSRLTHIQDVLFTTRPCDLDA